jgi:hypothetical protein
MVFFREETACFLCTRNRNIPEAVQISKPLYIYTSTCPHSSNSQTAHRISLAFVRFVHFPASVNQHGDALTVEVEATLTLIGYSPEVMYEKNLGKMCTFLISTYLQVDDGMKINRCT